MVRTKENNGLLHWGILGGSPGGSPGESLGKLPGKLPGGSPMRLFKQVKKVASF